MADLKITSLPALAEAGIQATDVLALADLSASETKKVTVKDLVAAAVALLDTGDIPASKVGTLGSNQVASGALADGAVTNAKLANSNISLGGVTIALGGTDATPAFNLADATGYTTANLSGTITNAQLAGGITGAKLSDATISYAKLNLSDGDISGAKITGNSITNAQIGADAVGSSELADDAVDTNAIANSAVTNTKLANSSISLGGVSIALGETDATPAFNLTDATNYPASSLSGTVTNAQLAGSITGDKLANSTVTYAKLNISDGDIAGAKITGNSITAAQIGANAVTASELADNAVDTAAVVDAAITSAKIAANTITAGNLAANSVGASELANNAVDTAAVVDGAITTDKIADGAITTAKLDGTISANSIGDNTVTSAKIAANAVGATELADNAVDTGAVVDSAITNAKIATGISGTKISDGTVTAAKLNSSNLDRSLNIASGNLGINNVITAATRSGITYNAQGLITATTALAAADLPVATSSAVGGVSVGTGLSVNGSGVLALSNSVTAATVSGITFNAQGQITAATALTSANLPIATTSAKGAVQITSGGGLSVDGSGNLTTATSGISAGTYQSITVNNKGVATAGASLTESLIPSLPASKITTGTLDAARIGADSIDSSKLSNSSTTIIQSIAQLGYPTAAFTGQLLFDPIAEDAYLWDGNAWNPITTLTKGALVRLGTYDASQSQVDYVTSAGAAAGLSVGQNLPAASSAVDGGYVVVSVQGTPSGVSGITGVLKPPDYLLGVTNTSGSNWVEIDLSSTVASQTANQIGYTPFGQLASTNVQAAIDELETEKIAKAGGTVTGELLIGNTGSLVFEGATADAFETKLTVADPTTSDKVITLPDITGTVITTGDTGTVTGTMLANGTIQNVDIKSDAAIAFSKLAALTSAQILVGNGSNVPTAVAVTGDIGINNAGLTSITAGAIVNADVNASAAIDGSKITTGTTSAVGVLQLTDSTSSTSTTTAATPNAVKSAYDLANTANTTAGNALPKTGGTLTGNLILDNAKELRFSEGDGDGANYTAFKAQAQTSDITLTLPATAPTANQVLKANASTPTTLEWATDTTNTAAADLTGSTLASGVTASSLTSVGTLTSLTVSGTITGDVTGDLTGNADTATKFASSVNIGGVAFDGSANINLPGVNATGTQDTSGTAALATQFTVTANNSTDETVYPLFADGATGSQGAETDTGLTYNPSTGLLTSTGFSGAGTSLTALNASNLSSGTVATARLGTGTASSSNFLRGDNTWQTIDLTALSASNLTSGTVPDARFPATLPAASGANLTALNASNLSSGTVNVARLGTGSSVSTKFLRGDNTWQTVSSTPEGTAILSTGESGATKFLREDGDGTCSWQSVVTSASGSNTQVQFNDSGSFAGSSSLTFNSGTGALTATSFVGNVTGNLTGTVQTAAQANITSLGTLTGLSINGDLTLTGADGNILWDKSETSLKIDDDVTAYWGDGADLQIEHFASGNVSRIYNSATGGLDIKVTTGALRFKSESGGAEQTGATYTPAAGWSFGHAGAARIATSGTGVNITGVLDVDGHVDLSDSDYLRLGDSQDLQLGNNGTNNFIQASGSLLSIATASDHAVQIKHNDSTKLATTSSGVAVTGGLTVSGDLTVSGTTTTVNSTTVEVADKNIELGKVSSPSDTTADGGGLTLKGSSDKTFNWVNSTDAWTSSEHIQVASGKRFIGGGSGITDIDPQHISGGTLPALNGSNLTALNASNIASGTIAAARVPTLNQNTTGSAATVTNAAQSAITSLGTLTGLTVSGTATFNNSSGTLKAKITSDGNYKNEDSVKFIAGTGNDLQIHHTGGVNKIISHNGGMHIREISNSDIHIHAGANDASSNNRFVARAAGQAEIYHNGNKKLESTSSGVTVTGTVTATSFSGSGANLTNLPSAGLSITSLLKMSDL